MKGSLGIDEKPFRFGGIMHDYDMDVEEWAAAIPKMRKCYACGGVMRNTRSPSGTLLAKQYPYCATYKVIKGERIGKYHFGVLCRACAYAYGVGVIEMDGNTYQNYYEFSEAQYKKERVE